jgi:hypothetical protein
MKRWRISILVLMGILIISLLVLKLVFHQFKLHVYDGFEDSKLSKIWTNSRMEQNAFEVQSEIVHRGKYAAKITLKYGDKVEIGKGKDKDSERDELLESRKLYAVEDIRYEYQFSMLLPDSFPVLPVRLVIAQWKQDCPFCSCRSYSPILALRYESGRLFMTLQTDSVRHELYSTNEEIRGHWLNFRFLIRFSKGKNGEVTTFLDNKKVVDYKGVTSYPNDCRILSTKNKYFFKMGLYRDRIVEPMTIYIDDYKKNRLE